MFYLLSEVKYMSRSNIYVIHIVAGNAIGNFSPPQIYRILGKTVVCYPIVFDLSDFYLSQDVMLLIDDIKVRYHTSLVPQTMLEEGSLCVPYFVYLSI